MGTDPVQLCGLEAWTIMQGWKVQEGRLLWGGQFAFGRTWEAALLLIGLNREQTRSYTKRSGRRIENNFQQKHQAFFVAGKMRVHKLVQPAGEDR